MWGERTADVRAIVLSGSAARDAPGPWSDFDFAIFCREPSELARDTSWIRALGRPIHVCLENAAVAQSSWGGSLELKIMFVDGVAAEAALIPCRALGLLLRYMSLRQRSPRLPRFLPAGIRGAVDRRVEEFVVVARRGIKIVVDKDRLLARARRFVPSGPQSVHAPPTAGQLENAVFEFLFDAGFCARKIRMGERWMAATWCGGPLKRWLVLVIEWHARARGVLDVWYQGRFIERWADADIRRRLPDTFAPYDAAGLEQALRRSIDLFLDVASELAALLAIPFPSDMASAARAKVDRILEGDV